MGTNKLELKIESATDSWDVGLMEADGRPRYLLIFAASQITSAGRSQSMALHFSFFLGCENGEIKELLVFL